MSGRSEHRSSSISRGEPAARSSTRKSREPASPPNAPGAQFSIRGLAERWLPLIAIVVVAGVAFLLLSKRMKKLEERKKEVALSAKDVEMITLGTLQKIQQQAVAAQQQQRVAAHIPPRQDSPQPAPAPQAPNQPQYVPPPTNGEQVSPPPSSAFSLAE